MTNVITTNVDSHGSEVTEFTPDAFEDQSIANGYVPDNETTTIATIGQYVRSLMGDNTPELNSLKVERIDLENDTPFYNMTVRFSDQFPIPLQTDIGDEWKIHSMKHKDDETVVKLRYNNPVF